MKNTAHLSPCFQTHGNFLGKTYLLGCYQPLQQWGISSLTIEAPPMSLDLSMPILVVDDYQTMVRIIRNLLKKLGFTEIDDASDGAAAIVRLKDRSYGLVISDWNMQPMTGYELLQRVRADEILRTMPFLMVTAESKIENVIAAKKAGVNNYIVKPFTSVTLKAKIEAVCLGATGGSTPGNS